MSVETIGFIGLGNMGAPMAGRLLDAGYGLIVHDVRQAVGGPLLARGARWAGSPAGVAAAATTIITIVPSSKEVRAVFEGSQGILGALQAGALCIEMTTADPSATRELAPQVEARGAHLIDAPVSGGVRGATDGSLAIMVGGAAALLDRARPVFERMGKNIFHAGPVGAGHAIKLVNNMCSGGILALTIEAVAVAAKAGVDPARAVEIIQASSGRSNASDYKFPKFILSGAFDAGFAIRLMLKDVDGYGRLAQEGGVPSPVGRAATEIYRMAVARGMGDLDHTAVARLIEEWAGIELRSKPGDPK
jgi:3-hydroxyisobutyrate dehydrogenase